MANNNIDQRIRYRKGSSKPEQPKHEKLNGNVFSIFPIPHEKPWYEDKPQEEDNGDRGVDASDRQQREADRLWKIELKKMQMNPDYIPKIIDPEDIRITKRPIPPQPYGADTFGWQEYENYLDKIGPGAIPIPFDKFMDQLDMLPSDQWGRRPRKKEGVMTVVGDTSAWHKKYLRNFGYSREYLDRLNRDDLERLFDDIMVRSTRRGRA